MGTFEVLKGVTSVIFPEAIGHAVGHEGRIVKGISAAIETRKVHKGKGTGKGFRQTHSNGKGKGKGKGKNQSHDTHTPSALLKLYDNGDRGSIDHGEEACHWHVRKSVTAENKLKAANMLSISVASANENFLTCRHRGEYSLHRWTQK